VRQFRGGWGVARPSVALVALVLVQVGLGCGAWVVNYGFPARWFAEYSWAQQFVVRQESQLQALVTTAHVATGSLILALSVVVALRSRWLPAARQEQHTEQRLARVEVAA
jgi:cytochrome c oxidase assembly protein subunit 15